MQSAAKRVSRLAVVRMERHSRAAMRATQGRRLDLLGLTKAQFMEASTTLLPGAGDAGKLYRMAFRTGAFLPPGTAMGPDRAAAWEDIFGLALPEPTAVLEEEGEGGTTAKTLLRYADGEAVECVRVPMDDVGHGDGRSTLCVSSQVGCRMACAFCETGRRGLVRNLTAGEIVAEALAARTRSVPGASRPGVP